MILPKVESQCSMTDKIESNQPANQKMISRQQLDRMAMRCAHRATPAILPTQWKTAIIKPNPIENQQRNH